MGIACISGGVTGFLRTGSKPSLIAGCAVGALYLYSGGVLLNGDVRGYYGAGGEHFMLYLRNSPVLTFLQRLLPSCSFLPFPELQRGQSLLH